MIINIERKYTGSKDINIKLLDNEEIIYNNINDLLKIESIEKLDNLNNYYSYLFKQLNLTCVKDIGVIIGKSNVEKHLCHIKNCLNELKNRDLTYYENHFWQRLKLTEMISDSTYDHAGTVTGRSRILDGINYLTMKKEKRENIKTSFQGGKIIEIDIVSLEPRILCNYNKMQNFKDVYNHTKKILNLGHLNRDTIKLGLLAIIYGAGKSTVKKLSGIDYITMQKIKDYFKVEKLNNLLTKSIEEKGYFRNMYNRPIFSKNALVNHFIQSSAADCAQLAFYQYLVEKDKEFFKLIAVIHDAIIIDAHPRLIDDFMNTYKINEKHLKINLPVKAEIIA